MFQSHSELLKSLETGLPLPAPAAEKVDLENVQRILNYETIMRMNLPPDSWRAERVRRFGNRVIPRFGQFLVDLDNKVGREGIRKGALEYLPHLQQYTHAEFQNYVPETGPVLIAANHPGCADFAHIMAALPRNDSRVIAATDMLDQLPNGKNYFVYTAKAKKREPGESTRLIIEELKKGHCLILFPRGVIEPDPRWMVGAEKTLTKWKDSMERMAKAVPNLTIVPTVVSGALSRRALNNWAVRFYRNQMLRARGAAIIQTGSSVLVPNKWRTDVLIRFGRPISGTDNILNRVRAEMASLFPFVRDPLWPIDTRFKGWL